MTPNETISPTDKKLPPELLVEKRGPAGWITFNDPPRHNAISFEMWDALPGAIARLEADPEVRAIVLTGAGDRAFVSGANIGQFDAARSGRDRVHAYNHATGQALDAIGACSKPTIARIRGYCIGGGVAIAAACDVRIASEDSSFSIPAARLGLGYRLSAMRDLVALIGQAQTLDIFLSARRLDCARALAINLVTHKVVEAELDAFFDAYVRDVAANAPLTMKAAKAMTRALTSPHPGVAAEDLGEMVSQCFDSEDYTEGKRAFADKRKPHFAGK